MPHSPSGPSSSRAEGQTFRLEGGGNAVPSIKGADEVVLEDGYPAHAQTFLDMRDIGFENYAAEARVPGALDRHQRPVPRALRGQGTTRRAPSTRSPTSWPTKTGK